jgi:acyl carrier protein
MPDLDERLVRCFRAVFPKLDEKSIPTIRSEQVSEWDSMASVTLVRVLEEEFGIPIDLFDLEDLRGFQDVRGYIEDRSA